MRINKGFAGLVSVAGLLLAGCGGQAAQDPSGYNPNSLNNSTNPVSSAASYGAATLGVKLIPLQGKPSFVVGMDVSSFSGMPERDFGKNPLAPNAEVWYSTKAVTTALSDISSAGCNSVRVALFSKLDGLTLDGNGLVTGLDDTFKKNFSEFLAKAEAANVQVYVSLGEPWNEISAVKDPITQADARTAFLKKAVVPLVGNLKGRSCILGLDLVDNIEAEIAGKDGNGTKSGVTWDQAQAYIKAVIQIVKSVDPQRLVSCGAGMHGLDNLRAGRYSKLGLDFYDVHVNDDKGNVPPAKDLKVNRPVLIGSCGQESKKTDDKVQATAIAGFLANASKLGYAGAMLSDYSRDARNPQSLLDKDGKHRPVFAELAKFAANQAMSATSSTATTAGPSVAGAGLGK